MYFLAFLFGKKIETYTGRLLMSQSAVTVFCCSFQVFTRECMSHYLRVFNFLWRAKRMEYILTDIRKGHMCNAKLLRNMPGKPVQRWAGWAASPPGGCSQQLHREWNVLQVFELKSDSWCAFGFGFCEKSHLKYCLSWLLCKSEKKLSQVRFF